MATAALLWLIFSLLGAVPFIISGTIPDPVDAVFETASGFSTTGSTILRDVEHIGEGLPFPKGMLFWRSFTHWVGGMGIIVLAIAIMPSSNDSLVLIQAESAGPEVGKLVPKGKNSSLYLYLIYAALTLFTIILLKIGGIPLFDSICNAMAIAGTGGFGITNSGMGFYNSVYIEGVTTITMILFGVNFSLYYYMCTGRFKEVKKNTELKVYFAVLAAATVLITANILPLYNGSIGESFRYAVFQVGSIMTSTGFTTANITDWPMLSKSILFLLVFIGACAGSTGGGFKVQRIVLLCKSAYRSIKKLIHPNSVNFVKSDGRIIPSDVVHGIYQYFVLYLLLIIVSVLIVSLNNMDFETTITSVVTCVNNIGPGYGKCASTFADFSVLSKIVFIFDMIMGRLEVLPFMILFSPKAWRRSF
jgi:trk system potassium uptake protein TrkH